jgi:hypothetical protein
VSQTPIYDELCRERINADVPAAGVNLQLVGQAGQHRLSGGTRLHERTYPADSGHGSATMQGAQAAGLPETLVRQPIAPAGRHSPTGRDTAQFSWFELPG